MKTPIYKIIFGKDPDFLGDDFWPDEYEKQLLSNINMLQENL